MNPKCLKEVEEFCKNNGVDYELFGSEVVHHPGSLFGGPIAPMGITFASSPFPVGGSLFGSSSVYPSSSGKGLVVGPTYSTAHLYKPPPIRYTSVSFPYSPKPKDDKDKKSD